MMIKLLITHNASSKWKAQNVDNCFKEWKAAPTMQSPCGKHKFQNWKRMERCTKALRSK
jgi:hypothetical protein